MINFNFSGIKNVIIGFSVFALIFAGAVFASVTDTLGLAGNQIAKLFAGHGMETLTGTAVTLLGALLFRLIQIGIQKLPTKWKWVNNKLTVGIITKIIGLLFGKTTTIYNAQIETSDTVSTEKAKEELRKKALEHLGRRGGILKEFEKAMKEMK